jgi:signal transduction histidine kinase
MSNGSNGNTAVLDDLDRLERLFADRRWSGGRDFVLTRARARERGLAALEGYAAGAEGARTALLVSAAELFGGLGTELADRPEEAARLVQEVEDAFGLSRIALGREVLRAPELLALSPSLAVDVMLALLLAFAPLRSASLWIPDAAGRVHCTRQVGDSSASQSMRKLARRLLAGDTEPSTRGPLLGFPIERREQPLAALVGRAEAGHRDRSRSFFQEALPMLAAILERDSLLARNATSERALVETSERKLARLGFDLHDGPLQDLAVLAEDLRLFRDQLGLVLGTRAEDRLLRGRLDDLDAQLVALDAELRRLSSSILAPVLPNQPFPRALQDVTNAFASRTKIEPRLTLEGDLSLLSASQQIALLNIVQEALSNIREHSDANKAMINISLDATGVEARVIDDGRGFDVEKTLVSAARRGRLGLAGVYERVRLLGGQCRIESRPGGPTVIHVVLPRWQPLSDGAEPSRTEAVSGGSGFPSSGPR